MEGLDDRVGGRGRDRLRVLLRRGTRFDLIEAALWVAAEEYPELEVTRERARLHFLADEGAARVEGRLNPFDRLEQLRDYVYVDLGFRGNSHNYWDPRNSFLNDVMNRRLGIPVTLSLVFMEIAAGAGFEVRGVGLPGHFIVRLDYGGRRLLVDPFHAARVITEDDCIDLVQRTTGRPELFRRELLEGVDSRGMLQRLLSNLKNVYVGQKNYGRALSVVDLLLLVKPGAPAEIRDRGLLQAHLGQTGPAIENLDHYLATRPNGPDATAVRSRLVGLRRRHSELN